jgi:hypothetical protein
MSKHTQEQQYNKEIFEEVNKKFWEKNEKENRYSEGIFGINKSKKVN